MPKHPLRHMLIAGLVAGVIGVVVVLAIQWFPTQASTAASKIDRLYYVAAVASVLIFALVMTVAIYSVWRFRARPGDQGDGAPIHGNAFLEVTWVVVPFLILVGLGVYAAIVLRDIEAKQPNPNVVEVTGQQFSWTFRYPTPGHAPVPSDRLLLPRDRQTELRLSSADVVHDVWIPAFRLKEDVVPGIVTSFKVTPTRDGEYDLVCNELCGLGHSAMRAPVTVMDGPAFDAWLSQGQQHAAGPPAQQASRNDRGQGAS